jgi:(p)ppGpp synthase/HD superfamily hydrolase
MPREYCEICKSETDWIHEWFEKGGDTSDVDWCTECGRRICYESGGFDTHAKIIEADKFAKERHQHQKRKDGITPYYDHLTQVVANLRKLKVSQEEVHCAGWLHDTIEDTNTDFEELEGEFGKDVGAIVASVTKDKRLPKEEREADYVSRLRQAGWKAQVVKLADIWANLADIQKGFSGSEAIKQVEGKLKYFEAIRDGLNANHEHIPKLDQAISEINKILATYGKRIDPLRTTREIL